MNGKRQRSLRKPKNPCTRCGLNPQLCICVHIPQLNLKSKLILLIHYKELRRTTNSGRLAVEALTNSSMKIRGQNREQIDLSEISDPAYESIILHPSEDALELDSHLIQKFKKPVQLIVPDGNWRQANKVAHRHQELIPLTKVKISKPNTAQFHLRKESTEYGMSTLEAIARAFGILEGPEIENSLLELYQYKLKATLKGRGISEI